MTMDTHMYCSFCSIYMMRGQVGYVQGGDFNARLLLLFVCEEDSTAYKQCLLIAYTACDAGAGGLCAGHGVHRGAAAAVHVRGGRVLDDDRAAEGRAARAAGGPLPAGPAAAAAVPLPVLQPD